MPANPLPRIEAHRGDSANAPENTLAAFRRAIALGVPSIELDVHPAKDGTLVVIHDPTVDRTTDGTGAVSGLSAEQLRRLDAGIRFGPAFAGERMPRLAEVFDLAAPTETRLNIEIKASPPGLNASAAVVELLRRFGKQRDYVVSSGDLPALLQVRALAPEITLAPIGNGPDILPQARAHQFPWIHGYYPTVDADLVARAHAGGIRVNVWTVDDPASFASWRAMGVDKICTNCPALMLAEARQAMTGDDNEAARADSEIQEIPCP